ncbi:hypothetical protein FPV67DRAFT_1506425 [Lyophyllum atratum]|nr:hypothetical protein FPV67DRAFT_1506425 [Lyophyllum atratum]
MPEFPWDSLKAETLRSLCRDLGMSRPSTRGAMIGFLTQVKEQGLEKAIAIESSQTPLKRKAAPALPITPSERRAGKTVSDYDTRHKRARLSDPGPGTSRKTSTRAVQNGTTDSSDKPAPKRRGRPPKTTSKLTPKTKTRKEEVSPPSAPISARREIFDGVVVPTVNFGASKGKAKAQEEMGDEDADGDIDMDHVEEQDDGRISRVESSLAGSNKENESVSGSDESAHQNSGEPVEGKSNIQVLLTESPFSTLHFRRRGERPFDTW